MNFKKHIAVLLLVLFASESTIWSANSNNAVPLFSPKQLKIGMDNFKNYLDKVQRCLVTGPCKREELMQIKKHGLFLLKLLAAGALIGVGIWKGKQAIERAPERIERGIAWVTRVSKKELLRQTSKKELLRQTLDILSEPEELREDATPEEREMRALKDGIKEALKNRFREGTAFTQEEIVAFVDDALLQEYGPETERKARMKENLRARFRGVVQAMVEEVEKLIKEFQEYLQRLWRAIPSQKEILDYTREFASEVAWSLPKDHDVIGIIEEMGQKLKDISPEKVVEIFKNEAIQKSLTEFINNIGDEIHILDLIRQLKARGVIFKYTSEEETKMGIPRKAILEMFLGPEEGEEESGDGPSAEKREKKKTRLWRIGGKKEPVGEESKGMEKGT